MSQILFYQGNTKSNIFQRLQKAKDMMDDADTDAEYLKGVSTMRRVLKKAYRRGSRVAQVHALTLLGNAALSFEQFDKALMYYSRARKLAEATNDYERQVVININLAALYDRTGQNTKRLAAAKAAFDVALANTKFHPARLSMATNNYTGALMTFGRLQEAAYVVQAALEMEGIKGYARGKMHSNLAGYLLELDDFGASLEHAQRAQQMLRDNKPPTVEDGRGDMEATLATLAELRGRQGDFREAEVWFSDALAIADQQHDEGRCIILRCDAALWGDISKADERILQAIGIDNESESSGAKAYLAYGRAHVAFRLGKNDDALWQAALEAAEKAEDLDVVRRIRKYQPQVA